MHWNIRILLFALRLAIAGAAALTSGAAHSAGNSRFKAGAFEWQRLTAGFEVAEMPVLLGSRIADRLLLARIDPARFRFVLRHAPNGGHTLNEWSQQLGAHMVINGSFFARTRNPAAPFLSEGKLSGPAEYDARHGAFIVSKRFTGIYDLREKHWRTAFRNATHGMVSFPLLVTPDGGNAITASIKQAYRSFVGQDKSGRIILGTTQERFFSLSRLAAFLRSSPLDLRLALNLDGGPYACQRIALGGYERAICGGMDKAVLRRKLPIVMAVLPRK